MIKISQFCQKYQATNKRPFTKYNGISSHKHSNDWKPYRKRIIEYIRKNWCIIFTIFKNDCKIDGENDVWFLIR